ncbi:MAG: AI-2E family transporter [Pseudomonadota bacterium]
MADANRNAGVARTFYLVALAVLIGVIAHVGRDVLIPFVIAVFLCFLIFTLKENIRRAPYVGKYLPNWLAYLLAFAAIGGAIMAFVEIIKTNVEILLEAWPAYEERLRGVVDASIAYLQGRGVIPGEVVGSVEELQGAALSVVRPLLTQAAGSLTGITSNFLTFITIFLYLVFMLIERGRIFSKIKRIGENGRDGEVVNETITDIGALVRQYITIKTISNLITATISFAIMKLIGVQFAGFWALLIFVFNYIPIFGAASAITLPALLALVQPEGGGVQMALITLASLIGAEQIMSNGIEPRLVGRTLNLSPLVVLFALSVWGSLWGFAGLLLSVPITVSVMLILTQFRSTRSIAILLSDDGEIAPLKHAPLGGAT